MIAPAQGSPKERQQVELARRRLARKRLYAFCWYTFRGYIIDRVHEVLAWHLEQVETYVRTKGREGIGRLMVFEPPRHGKSELVSVRFPAWFIGRNPDYDVILTSNEAGLATGFSRQVRNIIRDHYFQNLFGVRSAISPAVVLSGDSQSAGEWALKHHRGGLRAAGVGGSIIGRGAHVAIIDDPFRDRAAAESKLTRDGVEDWYRSTLYTRLEDAGAIVLMHQRWHSDDLAGRLIRRMVEEPGADQWTILNLPALAEEWAERVEPEKVIEAARQGWWMSVDALGRKAGEALWPGKYPQAVLERIKANLGGYEWESLYQQRPQPVEGALIKAGDIIRIRADQLPKDLRVVRYWDLAVSGKQGADFIAGAKVGRSPQGGLYLLHMARIKGPWAEARPKMIEVMRTDGPGVEQGIEVAGQQAGYFQELQRDEKLLEVVVKPVSPQKVGNKEVRANIWAYRIQDGLVFMVNAPWNEEFVSEAVAFPRGAHDDQVDAVSGAVQMLGVGMGSIAELHADDEELVSRWQVGDRRLEGVQWRIR